MLRNLSILLTLLFSLSFVACTGGDGPAKDHGNAFYINLGGEPSNLHPIMSTDYYSSLIHKKVLDTLLVQSEDTYEWMPRLAEKWEISDDNKVFTFFLRKDAVFHDGKPITAEDVKFTYDAILDPQYQAAHVRPYLENIEKVEIVDPHTIKFYAKNTYFGNFSVIAGDVGGGGILAVLPKHIYSDVEKSKRMTNEVVGSGPYKLTKYDKGNRIVLEKFEKWYGNDLPIYKDYYNFEKIVYRFVKDENPALEMIKKGNLDYVGLSTDAYAVKATGGEWGKEVKKFAVENLVPKPYGFIGWNLRKPLFQDRDVRVALAHLLNRELINEKFRHGLSLLATGPVYRQSEYANPDVEPLAYDPAKARELLKKAGWEDTNKDGVLDKVVDGKRKDFRFTLTYPNKDVEKYWTLYKEDLKKAGIDMEIKLLEWQSFLKLVDEGSFDAITMGWNGGSIDWDPKQIWHSDSAVVGGSNFINYKNPEVDKLIDQARFEVDKEKRKPLLRKVYKMIADDAPYVFLFNDKYYMYGVRDRIQRPKDTYTYDVGTNLWSVSEEAE